MSDKFQSLLEDLKKTGVVKVTGSYASGEQTSSSDIDFFVKYDKPETPREEYNIRKVIAVLDKYGIIWDSTCIGYIHTHKCNNSWLPIEIEFSDLFEKRLNKLPTVTIYGVTFKTY